MSGYDRHGSGFGAQSRYEQSDGTVDPKTAHTAAGDTGYKKTLLKTCGLCQATALAKAQQTLQEKVNDANA